MTNHKYKYLIKMTPLNTFFFGGEKTFTTPTGETNYFARSNRFPQQTTVLGMLRYIIGKQYGFDPNKIGSHSFMANSNDGFGIIEKLSPVFLISKDENGQDRYLVEAGIDHQRNGYTGKIERKHLSNEPVIEGTKSGVYSFSSRNEKQIPKLIFDYKEFLIQTLFDNNKPDQLFDPFEFFFERFQVGNKKDYKGHSEDDAFFKQIFFRLKNSSFAVFLETKEELPFSVEIDTMGADQSLFRIEAEILKTDLSIFELIEESNKSKSDAKRIVLLSDACVDSTILTKCKFSICDTSDFRNIVTHSKNSDEGNKTDHFHRLGLKGSNSAYKTTIKYNLLRRGSVLYTDDASKLLDDLTNNIFNKIGYNNYQLTD